MGSSQLLLLSGLAEDLAFATEVAATAGLELIQCQDPEKGAALMSGGDVKVVLADTSTQAQYAQLERAIEQGVGLYSDRINANAIHFLSSEELDNVQYLVQSPLFGHFVIRNYGDPKVAGRHYGRFVRATQAPRAFGLESLLGSDVKIQTVTFKNSTQKQSAVEAVKNYLLAAKFQSRMATVIANAVDELLMNAMYDAPVDELGRQKLVATARTTPIELEGKSAVEMQVGFDGHFVAVSAVDLFGSLNKNKLLSHISKIYTDEEYKVKTSVAGAGIGLATVFRSGGSFFFVSENQVRTEVTVVFRRTDSFREFKDQFRFISTQFYF